MNEVQGISDFFGTGVSAVVPMENSSSTKIYGKPARFEGRTEPLH
jgi:hypothetical protein